MQLISRWREMSVEARVFRVFIFTCIGQGRPELACRQTGSIFGERRKKKGPVLFGFWITASCSAWVAHGRRPQINLSQRTMWYSDIMISKRIYYFSTAGKVSSSKLPHILVDRIWLLTALGPKTSLPYRQKPCSIQSYTGNSQPDSCLSSKKASERAREAEHQDNNQSFVSPSLGR